MDNRKENNGSTVKQLREIRDRMNIEIQDMNANEVKAYYRKKRKLHPNRYKDESDRASAA